MRDYLRERRDALVAAGVVRERICLDPGIGFGKTHEHNIDADGELLRVSRAWLPASGRPFAEGLPGQTDRRQGSRPHERDGRRRAGLAVQGVQIVRVHDVRPVREALAAFEACGGFE